MRHYQASNLGRKMFRIEMRKYGQQGFMYYNIDSTL